MKISRIILVIAVLGFGAGSCFAPIEDRPSGKEFHRELTDDELSKYQTCQLTNTPEQTGVPQGTQAPSSSAEGRNEALKVLEGSQLKNQDAAIQSLERAAKDVKSKSKSSGEASPLLLGGIFVLIGLGVFVGLRSYLDKNVPDGPTPYKSKR